MASNSRNLSSHSFRGQRSKIKASAGLVLLEGSKGESDIWLSPSFWSLLAILGVPWLIDPSLQSLPLSLYSFLPMCLSSVFLCPKFPLLIRTLAIGFMAHLSPVWLHLNLAISGKTVFPKKVVFPDTIPGLGPQLSPSRCLARRPLVVSSDVFSCD